MKCSKRPKKVVLFAGCGGADKGIEAVLGPMDVAINHSPTAIAVHRDNFPAATHYISDVWEVSPEQAVNGHPVDVLWASPDCTHFSVAKGGAPREKGIRSLAWVVVDWARRVRPRCIFLENVSEFRTWGPLGPDGRPDKARMGETFDQWLGALLILGYRVDYRVLDASEYGARTKRRRLFLVARCDGLPIRWPEKTHGTGPGLQPLRTAAECIDWTLPCPSIFDRKKPLAEKTMWRIAEGLRRFVLENPEPFIVGCGGRAGQTPPTPVGAPVGTITAKNDRALVVPSLVKVNHGGRDARGERIDAPLSTVTATQRGHAVVAAHLTKFQEHSTGQEVTEPLHTVLAGAQRFGVVAPTLIQTGYGERPGQRARYLDLHEPLGTVVADGQKHALVSAFIAKHFGDQGQRPGSQMAEPLGTITATDHHAVTAVKLDPYAGERGDDEWEAFDPRAVTSHRDHVADVRAFLTTYYGEDATGGQRVDRPMRTITAKARMGLVTVAGVEHQIVDIGMRMLEPHELLRAQFGRFADTFDMSAAKSKAAKVRLIGNSVCPEVAEALVRANLGDELADRSAA